MRRLWPDVNLAGQGGRNYCQIARDNRSVGKGDKAAASAEGGGRISQVVQGSGVRKG